MAEASKPWAHRDPLEGFFWNEEHRERAGVAGPHVGEEAGAPHPTRPLAWEWAASSARKLQHGPG